MRRRPNCLGEGPAAYAFARLTLRHRDAIHAPKTSARHQPIAITAGEEALNLVA